mmetsp:Transcript_20800/g.45821  ORF Transcript_20800/g.45821 Transcript_20800/m.45821 type:complete len:86 (+) Transcript_20800:2636-2893(+)
MWPSYPHYPDGQRGPRHGHGHVDDAKPTPWQHRLLRKPPELQRRPSCLGPQLQSPWQSKQLKAALGAQVQQGVSLCSCFGTAPRD